ncbi:MAG: hypothetical protein ACXACU_18985 [Candidatus Hodarchaeales archaeon]|jgi:uncharacterized RDD family membrane protein YckC
MDERLTGSILIIIGLTIAGFGGTMSSIEQVIFYIIGFLMAFVGLGFFIKYRKKQTSYVNPNE